MQTTLAKLSGNFPKLLYVARAVSSRPAISLLCNFPCSSSPTNFTKIVGNNAHSFGHSAGYPAGQQQRFYTTDLPSIACKDLNKKPHEDFGYSICRHMLLDELEKPQRNILCSPVSINALLNMLVPGTKGQALDQFLDLLALRSEEKLDKATSRLLDIVRPFKGGDGPKITVTNGVWVDKQYSLTRPYDELLRNVHKAEVNTVDFLYEADNVVEDVNLWAKTKTKGMIKTILPDIAYYNDTVVILANTLHFKLESSNETFDPTDAQNLLYYSGSFGKCKLLRIPSKDASTVKGQDNRRFSMYIFVEPKKDGLLNFRDELKLDKKSLKKQFKRQNEEISDVYIPKFSSESVLPLSGVMKQLGLTLPFMASQSELLNFVDSPVSDLLYVTDVTQKIRIETNDGGTSFAVSTYATLCGPTYNSSASSSKLKFVAGNSFAFMIRDDSSGAVVSVGTMLSSSLFSL